MRPRRTTTTISSVQRVVSQLSAKITRSMTQPLTSTKHPTKSPSTPQCSQISLRIPRNCHHRRLQVRVQASTRRRDTTFANLVKYNCRRPATSTTSAVAKTYLLQQDTMKLFWTLRKRAPISTHLSRSTNLYASTMATQLASRQLHPSKSVPNHSISTI